MPTNTPSLTVVGGASAGAALFIDQVLADFSIGSGGDCHLIVAEPGVAPLHATVFLDDAGNVTIVDAQSGTGVFVNGSPVTEQVLSEGDEVSLGSPGSGSGLLRFSTGADAPLIDLDGGAAELASLNGLEPAAPSLDFAAEPADLGDISVALPGFEEPPPSPVDDFPPPEALAEPDPQPAPAKTAPPPPTSAKPKIPTGPVGSGLPASTPPRATGPASAGARKITGRQTTDDDPLAGLAESLGAKPGERTPPPPPVVAPTPAPAARKLPLPAIMAARVGAVGLVILLLAWWGYRKYADSIVIPVVDSYQPNPAEPGQTVTIQGSGYGLAPDPTVVKVMIGNAEAQVLDANPTRINITVPESLAAAGSQTLALKVTNSAGEVSTGRMLKISVAPKVASLAPRVGLSGDEITIAGKWLATEKTKPVVLVGGAEAEVIESSAGRIRFRIPAVEAREGQRLSLKVALGSDVSKEALFNFGRLPFLEAITPERAAPGEVVTISGVGLAAPGVRVTVGSRSAAILSATDNEVKISVPGTRLSESAGARDVQVYAGDRVSMTRVLDVRRESAALYSPRFFVEILDGGRAAVSCEVGPLMLLGPDGGSVKRANDAVTRLNQLAAQARENRVQFVAGETTISAQNLPVIGLAASDGSGNARSLASLWAAELTDLFDLFFQGRRPTRTVELSPNGKVLIDIFAAARRRSSEPGVPVSLLVSPDPAWPQAFVSLASSPSLGSSAANALLDGFWSGSLETTPPRKVDISISATPSGLFGQKTSRQGKLSSDASLDNLRFDRREVRFSYVESGETHTFAGRLDGDTIDGAVTKGAVRVGKLTFKLVR